MNIISRGNLDIWECQIKFSTFFLLEINSWYIHKIHVLRNHFFPPLSCLICLSFYVRQNRKNRRINLTVPLYESSNHCWTILTFTVSSLHITEIFHRRPRHNFLDDPVPALFYDVFHIWNFLCKTRRCQSLGQFIAHTKITWSQYTIKG